MPHCPASRPSVLIVDPSAENREVLRTVLGRRGLTVFEAEAADHGLELAREHHPDVIVLDVEEKQHEHSAAGQQFADEADASGSQLIFLGRFRRGPVFTGGHVISKPYHFAPLIHTIEQLAAKAA
jgi:DNA-binding NarL/FixJ family response regulator